MSPRLDSHILVARRRALRADATPAECRLWQALRARQFGGFKVRRQASCGPYILDFYVPAGRLAIEVDGDTHGTNEGQMHDAVRTAYLVDLGIRVVRITNREVVTDLPAVLTAIEIALTGEMEPSP
jgi:very-short-patch-repair endonuclease